MSGDHARIDERIDRVVGTVEKMADEFRNDPKWEEMRAEMGKIWGKLVTLDKNLTVDLTMLKAKIDGATHDVEEMKTGRQKESQAKSKSKTTIATSRMLLIGSIFASVTNIIVALIYVMH